MPKNKAMAYLTTEKGVHIYELTFGNFFENDFHKSHTDPDNRCRSPVLPIRYWPSSLFSRSAHQMAKGLSEKSCSWMTRIKKCNLSMDKSANKDRLSKLLNMRMVIVEVGIAETNEEAWLRHLTTHPEDLYTNIRIFNHRNIVREPRDLEIEIPEEAAKLANNK